MAKVDGNIFMDRLSGMVGDQMILRTVKGGRTIISKKARFDSKRKFTPAQLAQQQAFREAAAYGKMMKGEEIYISLANGTPRTPYNIAVGDYFNRPQIVEFDLGQWVNGDGGTIRVRAQDDVMVVGVKVSIADESGALLEEGEAVEVGALWWEYSTAQAAANNMRVTAAASDMPGHVTERTERKGHPLMV